MLNTFYLKAENNYKNVKKKLLFIAGSVIVLGIFNYTYYVNEFTAVCTYYNDNHIGVTDELYLGIKTLLELHTGVPANGYNVVDKAELFNMIREANFNFELGYTKVNGVNVYVIKTGDIIHSVEPNLFIFLLFSL